MATSSSVTDLNVRGLVKERPGMRLQQVPQPTLQACGSPGLSSSLLPSLMPSRAGEDSQDCVPLGHKAPPASAWSAGHTGSLAVSC